MILMKDVEAYEVGDQRFPVGLVTYDRNQHPWRGQGYHEALKAHEATGLPIVAIGENSEWDPREKKWVPAGA